jgi:protein disulfide-isomerase-like protein
MTLNWDQKVIELTMNDFDYWIERFDALMVEIYAPWCGHCKAFIDKYNDVGQQLFDSAPRYFVAKIDGHKYPEIAKRYEINGYPALIFFKRGKPVTYDGEMKAKLIVDYVKKHGPENVQLLDCG